MLIHTHAPRATHRQSERAPPQPQPGPLPPRRANAAATPSNARMADPPAGLTELTELRRAVASYRTVEKRHQTRKGLDEFFVSPDETDENGQGAYLVGRIPTAPSG